MGSSMSRLIPVVAGLLFLAAAAQPKHSSSSSRTSSHSSSKTYKTTKSSKTYRSAVPHQPKCVGCKRDSKGRIARSPKATAGFRKTHPCPATGKTSGACNGYVIDHVVPLKRGGADRQENMQWQTTAAAKAKDRIE